MQVTCRRLFRDWDRLGQEQAACIEPRIHLQNSDTRLCVAGEDSPLDRRCTSPSWQ